MADSVSAQSMENILDLFFSCQKAALVASFKFEKPVEVTVCSG